MSKYDAATLGCKILAVFFFCSAISSAVFTAPWPILTGVVSMGSLGALTLSTMAPGLIQATTSTVMGFVLWWFAPSIGRLIVPAGSTDGQ